MWKRGCSNPSAKAAFLLGTQHPTPKTNAVAQGVEQLAPSLRSASPVSASPPHSEPEQKSPHPRQKKDGGGCGNQSRNPFGCLGLPCPLPFFRGFPWGHSLDGLAASAQGRYKRAVLHSEKRQPRDRDLISRSQRVDRGRNRSYWHVTGTETRTILNRVVRLDVG